MISVVYPSFLVGDGAKQWAQQHDLPLIESQTMKTGSLREMHRHQQRYDERFLCFRKQSVDVREIQEKAGRSDPSIGETHENGIQLGVIL